ncbi:MAG: diguanylate cyclase [Oscillospiraceae bacterium]|nr:diguanylate cyclase [Oscillospiraceae bacterium]
MKKIMIVDDAQLLSSAAEAVSSAGYDVIVYPSGEAVDRYGSERPDLVLCELDSPQISGLELLSLLSERYSELIPILFTSDSEDSEAESRAFDAGAMDYVRRPFMPSVLLHRIDNALRQIDSVRQLQGLKVVAETDPMTGLYNKVFVQKTLGELCARADGTLMMIDLDNFKLVNDLYGHGMGDRVIIRFADILRGVIRSSDDIVGRVGGDEFMIFCRDVHSERLIADKTAAINSGLLEAAREYMGADMNIPLGASVGAVFVPEEGRSFDELFKKADKALYTAKENGKHGCAFFHGTGAQGGSADHQNESPSLIGARKILEERVKQRGAYETNFDDFRSIFRFISRRVDSYHYDVEFILFSFDIDIADEKVEAFGNLLHRTLRRSDVFSKSSRTQYMVLLPQPVPDHGEAAIRRVMEKWRQLDARTNIYCEHESLLGEE